MFSTPAARRGNNRNGHHRSKSIERHELARHRLRDAKVLAELRQQALRHRFCQYGNKTGNAEGQHPPNGKPNGIRRILKGNAGRLMIYRFIQSPTLHQSRCGHIFVLMTGFERVPESLRPGSCNIPSDTSLFNSFHNQLSVFERICNRKTGRIIIRKY